MNTTDKVYCCSQDSAACTENAKSIITSASKVTYIYATDLCGLSGCQKDYRTQKVVNKFSLNFCTC